MNELSLAAAAAGARTLAKNFRAVLAVGEVLEEVASLDNLRREREAAAEGARLGAEAARGELHRVNVQLAASRDDLERLVLEGKAATEGARQAAEAILAEASVSASEAIEAAEVEASFSRAAMAAERRRHEDTLAELRRQEAEVGERVAALTGKLADLRRSLGWET